MIDLADLKIFEGRSPHAQAHGKVQRKRTCEKDGGEKKAVSLISLLAVHPETPVAVKPK